MGWGRGLTQQVANLPLPQGSHPFKSDTHRQFKRRGGVVRSWSPDVRWSNHARVEKRLTDWHQMPFVRSPKISGGMGERPKPPRWKRGSPSKQRARAFESHFHRQICEVALVRKRTSPTACAASPGKTPAESSRGQAADGSMPKSIGSARSKFGEVEHVVSSPASKADARQKWRAVGSTPALSAKIMPRLRVVAWIRRTRTRLRIR